MGIFLFVGSALIAWGPTLALAIFTVFPFPFMLASFLASFIFVILAYFCASLMWLAFETTRDESVYFITWGFFVFFIEVARLLFFHAYHKFKSVFSAAMTNSVMYPSDDRHFAWSAGLGFGLTSQLLFFGSFIIQSAGKGTILMSAPCQYHPSAPINAAIMASSMSIANVAFSMASTFSYSPKSHPKLGAVVFIGIIVSHCLLYMVPTGVTMRGWCWAPVVLPPVLAILCVFVSYVLFKITDIRQAYVTISQQNPDENLHLD